MQHFKRKSAFFAILAIVTSPALLVQAQSIQPPPKSAPPAAATSAPPSAPSSATGSMQGQTASMGNASSSVSRSDRKFMEKAAQGGMAEVDLGRLAAQQGASDQVKQFGQRMADDHSKLNDQLKQIASTKGVTLPADMGTAEQQEHDKLAKLTGSSFDREYMKAMVSDHKKDLSEFQSKSKSAKDPDLKAFASDGASVVQQHYDLAKSTQAALK